jgi:penicillin G amidase
MRRSLSAALAAAGLGGGLWLGARGAGVVPPLGGLLDPMHGAWAAARFAGLPEEALGRIENLQAAVEVRYDRRGVPHIFASSIEDATRALGYVVARDRLFQMDLQTHAASGRLTEWAGGRALETDQEVRRIGLPRAAERALAALAPSSVERRVIDAYADGVNAYIAELKPDRWPIEYRILGVRPIPWEPINSLHLFNYMGRILALLDDEKTRFEVAALVGDSAAAALFPIDAPIQEPIQPNGEGAPRFALPHLPPPGPSNPAAASLVSHLPRFHDVLATRADGEERRSFASNNWAVAPRRTRDGMALLAGDPHLELTLPSLWYEAHLVVPGVIDAYGVTIPGAPGIILGFNRHLGWSFTNTGADVLDFYRETVDDSTRPARYMLDGSWRVLERRLETYRDKRGQVVGEDTLLFSHRGPLFHDERGWTSMRWTVLEPDVNLRAFVDAPRATNAREFLDTMARFFGAPAQNIIVADRSGSIAIRSTGRYPLRPDDGSGVKIRDGSTSASDWRGYWPVEKYPQSFDPPQGYLASANQQPIDPKQAPAYLGYEAAYDPWRALQINRLLRADSAVTVDAMRRYQTDPGSVRAERFAPYFVAAARAKGAGGGSSRLDSALTMLAAWDRRYTRESDASVLFEASMRQVPGRLWDELVPNGGEPRRVATPSSAILLALMQDSASLWWDDRRTGERHEDRDEILAASLEAAYDSLTRRYGARSSGAWQWGRAQAVRVPHLLRLPGFAAPPVAIQGGPGTLNPAAPVGYGPSWRMVVELGPVVRAWGTYPGGQSGNPASPRYMDRLSLWADGQLDTLFVPTDTNAIQAGGATRARLRLTPEGSR